MQFKTVFSLTAILASTAVSAQSGLPDPTTWDLYFWTGDMCTADGSGDSIGPSKAKKGTVCETIPDMGTTKSADFYAGGSQFSLGFYTDSKCKNAVGDQYIGVDGEPTCVPVPETAVYWGITTS